MSGAMQDKSGVDEGEGRPKEKSLGSDVVLGP
jgi:hypothetical protein